MNIEFWLLIARGVLLLGTAFVAVGTIATSVLMPLVDKEKDKKIDELLQGNKNLQSSNNLLASKIDGYQQDLYKKDEKIRELKKQILPRELTKNQKAELLRKLLIVNKAPIIITSRLSDAEGKRFAEQIAEVFRASGWNVKGVGSTYIDDTLGDVNFAIVDESQRPIVNELINILNQSNIRCIPESIREGSVGGGIDPGHILMVVGSKKLFFD